MRLSLEAIANATGGTIIPGVVMPSDPIEGVGTDSRAVTPKMLFACIPGERFDGHQFAGVAADAGAAAIIAERNPFSVELPIPLICVSNTVVALGKLANTWRHTLQSGTKVVSITGTAGKTTVKELLAQVLHRKGKTAKNHLNLNNQIGLPLSMLNTDGDELFWVMEAGISHPQDMDELGVILEPDIGLILNVGPGHAAGLGDKGTAWYKSRLLAHLAPGGTAVVSADYPDLVREARSVRQDLVFFSIRGLQVEYRAGYVAPIGKNKGLFRLWLDGDSVDMEAPFRGSYGAENLIAVAAIAHQLGLSIKDIAAGMADALLPEQRFSCSCVGNWLVIDDSYNANPLSFERMLESAVEMVGKRSGKLFVCVLGEMGELGQLAVEAHRALGRNVAAVGPDIVLWKGAYGEDVDAGLAAGHFAGTFSCVNSVADMFSILESCSAGYGQAGGVILFKGSRVNRLERFVTAFVTAQSEKLHAV